MRRKCQVVIHVAAYPERETDSPTAYRRPSLHENHMKVSQKVATFMDPWDIQGSCLDYGGPLKNESGTSFGWRPRKKYDMPYHTDLEMPLRAKCLLIPSMLPCPSRSYVCLYYYGLPCFVLTPDP